MLEIRKIMCLMNDTDSSIRENRRDFHGGNPFPRKSL